MLAAKLLRLVLVLQFSTIASAGYLCSAASREAVTSAEQADLRVGCCLQALLLTLHSLVFKCVTALNSHPDCSKLIPPVFVNTYA